MVAKKGKLYDEHSIESLTPLEFTRLRPGVYAGDTTYSTQLLVEIVSNAVDEFRLGHGNRIDVQINDDIVSVRDYGQGFIPNSFRDDGKTILEASFSVLNTSGKYREDGTYEGTSLGSFGIGSKITTFLSHWLEVETRRDGQFENITFKEGVFDKREKGTYDTKLNPSGTIVTWQASEEFFTHPSVEVNKIKTLFETLSCLCQGLEIHLTIGDDISPKEYIVYKSENGLNDLVDKDVKDKELIDHRCIIKYAQDKNQLDFILTYVSDYGSTMIPYVNTGLTEKGPHITTIKGVLTRQFNDFFREKGWLKDKEENLSGSDLSEGMYVVFNLTAPNIAYDAQVKSTVTKIDMGPFTIALTENLKLWFKNNEKDIKLIADKALAARRAREAAQKARDNARNAETKGKSKFINLPTKLVDAWSKKRDKCELYITEGDSAAGGLVTARVGETQAVFPIRGKIISCRKQTPEKVYANQEVANIVKALGLEISKSNGRLIYNKEKLRYNKIIFACDADPDGEEIKNLLITCFWWLCPELVTNGHVYVAVPPLFRITTKKNEYIYLKDGAALEDYKQAHVNEKYLINRMKGLGEQDPEELAECLLDEKTRNIQQIVVEDYEKADDLLETLMGTAVSPRRDFLLKYGEEANID